MAGLDRPGRRAARRAATVPDPRGAFDALVDLVRILPVPNTRPAFVREDEAAGLTLLHLGMRMDHVQRITESLTLIDRTHMRRAMALDLDLRTLTAWQRQAIAVRPLGPLEAPGPAVPLPGATAGRDRLWVPVAWQSREHAAPVVIHDDAGDVVPRLTGEATLRMLAAALTRLLKNQVRARLGATRPDDSLAGLELQSRWLIERAIVILVERGLTTAWSRMAALAAGGRPDGRTADGPPARAGALAYLELLGNSAATEFGYLLDLVAREQLLVAMLPAAEAHPHLRFEAAPVPVLTPPRRVPLRLRELLPVNREYTVEYSTQVPRRVSSYHLTIEVPEGVRVRRSMLATDADEIGVEHLSRDLDRLACRAAVGAGDDCPELEEAQLQDALARVASLSRLRFAELQGYREYVRRFRARFGWELPRAERRARTAAEVAAALAAGRCDLSVLAALAVHQEHGTVLPELHRLPAAELAAALGSLRDQLTAAELGRGVTVDNDPRDNGAHASWRHLNPRFGPRPLEPVTAAFHLSLADEPPALVESVVRMLLGLLAVLGVLWWLLRGRPTDGLQSDALVAVLLLVPSILLSRLDLPKGPSILGELRVFPRRIAYLSVILTSGVALVAASDGAHFVPAIRAGTGALLALLLLSLVELAARGVRRRAKVPRSAVMPRWLTESMGVAPGRPPLPPDARFLSVGALAARAARLGSPAPRPADLVSLAAETAAQGSTGVAFDVVHAPRVASTHSVDGGHSLQDDCPDARELLGFTAYGSTFEIRTRQVSDPAAIPAADRPAGFLVRNARTRHGTRSEAHGLVALPPDIHRPGSRTGEFLVVLGDHEDTSRAQSLMTTHLVAELMGLIAQVGALPVFLHGPAAPRPQMRTATERARPAVLPVLRWGLADDAPFSDARVAFAEQAVSLAREYGVGLCLGEGRASGSPNHWREVVPFDRARYHRARRARFSEPADRGVGEAAMVTLAGPASSRTAGDLHRLATGFEALGLGCLAVSAWSMHRTVFVNALLPCRTTAGGPSVSRDPGGQPPVTAADVVPLASVVRDCSLLPGGPGAAGPLDTVLPQRFSIVLASRTGLLEEPGDRDEQPERVVPYWVLWDVPAPADIDVVTFRLTGAFQEEGRHAAVAFLRARRTSDDRLRGRAKVAVTVPRSWGTADFGHLALRVQFRAQEAIREDYAGCPGAITVQVAWGERWLGTPP